MIGRWCIFCVAVLLIELLPKTVKLLKYKKFRAKQKRIDIRLFNIQLIIFLYVELAKLSALLVSITENSLLGKSL